MIKQIGGAHYVGDYQHWDWALDVGMPSMLYAATKYLDRLGEKEPVIVSLDKSISYLKKWLERLDSMDIQPNVGGTSAARKFTTRYDKARESKWKHPIITKKIAYMADDVLRRNDIREMILQIQNYRDHQSDIASERKVAVKTVFASGSAPFGYRSDEESVFNVGDEVYTVEDLHWTSGLGLMSSCGNVVRQKGRVQNNVGPRPRDHLLVSWPVRNGQDVFVCWVPVRLLRHWPPASEGSQTVEKPLGRG